MEKKTIRVGGASGYWGESAIATPQLIAGGSLGYLVYDYLAEITMSILARAKAKDPEKGYANDFIDAVLRPNLTAIASQGIKVISNAGGVNPIACAKAARLLIEQAGLDLKVAVISGDDLIDQREAISADAPNDMFSGAEFPAVDTLASMNAYIGAFPIATALENGADIIITGRVVDSAVTLGACIHAFGWQPGDFDLLAAGSLAGHILECGPQATGGNFTDWQLVASSLATIGYPIAEISDDGDFICTKAPGTGGLVSVGTVSEQLLYEIGDPQTYILPDVICDFSAVEITQEAENRVHVRGARGRAPTSTYKVCATYQDGYRGGTMLTFYGFDADKKAKAYADALFERAAMFFRFLNLGDFTETNVEILGAESQFGNASGLDGSREVVLKFAARHPDPKGIGILLKEAMGLGLATPPGLSGMAGTRTRPSPVLKLFSFLIGKSKVTISIDVDGTGVPYSARSPDLVATTSATLPAPPALPSDTNDKVEVPLIALAWGRSGDKGDKANIGIIARDTRFLPFIWHALTEDIVAERFAHFSVGAVEKFFLPGPNAINFLLDTVLGGGGVASLRNDPQGKGYAQLLLHAPIPVPFAIAAEIGQH